MKRLILTVVVGVLAGAGGVWGQPDDLPVTPIWTFEFNGWNGAWIKDTWMENGTSYFLMQLLDRALIVSDGEVVWQSPRGVQSNSTMRRVLFADGPAILIGNNTGNGAYMGKYAGESYANIDLFRFGDRPGPVISGTGYDIKAIVPINIFSPEPNDSGVIVGFDEWTQSYDYNNDPDGYTLNGGLNIYRFRNQNHPGDFSRSGGVGELVEKRDNEGFLEYLIYRSINSEFNGDSNETVIEWLVIDPDLSIRNHVGTSGEFAVTFVPEVDNHDLVCSIHYTYDNAYLKILTTPQLETIYLETIPRLGSMRAICHYFDPTDEAGHHYLLVTSAETGQVVVFDLTELRLLGVVYEMPPSVIWMQAGDFDGDIKLELAVVTPSNLTVYEIEPLGVNRGDVIYSPSSLHLSSFPNPFNSSATINFSLDRSFEYRLLVIDPLGRIVRDLTPAGGFGLGRQSIIFDATGLPTGTYFARFAGNGQAIQHKLTLIK